MSRHTVRLPVLIAVLVLLPALASAQQSVSINLGYFQMRGEDSRTDGDVLLADQDFHVFDFGDFNGFTINGEWLIPIGDYLEAGAGVGYYGRTVPSVYRDLVNESGAEIEQDFKLRIVPISATVRFLPLGHGAVVEPYVGAGLGVFLWRYTETGQFVDENYDIFNGRFKDNGTNFGPLVFGGVRLPVTHTVAIGGEVRYQRAEGKLNSELFNGDKIDLGGLTWQGVLQFRF